MLNGLTIPTVLVGNDLATQGTYGFRIRANTELRLAKVADADGSITILTLGTHYTVNGINDPSSSNWTYTLVTALAAGYKVYAYPMLSLNQPDEFSAQEGNFAETIEAAFDRIVVRQGQQQYELDRSLKVDVGAESVTPAELSEQLSTAVSSASASASAASASAGTASSAASTATTKAGEASQSALSVSQAITIAAYRILANATGDIAQANGVPLSSDFSLISGILSLKPVIISAYSTQYQDYGAAWGDVSWIEEIDTDSIFSSNTLTITSATAGTYKIEAQLTQYRGGEDTDYKGIRIVLVRGGNTYYHEGATGHGTNNSQWLSSVNKILALQNGDTVKIQYYGRTWYALGYNLHNLSIRRLYA